MLKLTLTKSVIGYNKRQRATVRALGLGKMGSSAIHAESDSILGMVRKVPHLLTVEKLRDPVEADQ
ncbi:MAG: 50S ribosomal protein L30 [Armatimonadetes bacterium RBG_16_58_9]|nr:MAG: 50S ribosomal protein L30 [Armatimonadetes bacterium RBG_16_58_9]